MDEVMRRVKVRLVISTIMCVTLLISSWVTFYYLHSAAPIVPGILGIMASFPDRVYRNQITDADFGKKEKAGLIPTFAFH